MLCVTIAVGISLQNKEARWGMVVYIRRLDLRESAYVCVDFNRTVGTKLYSTDKNMFFFEGWPIHLLSVEGLSCWWWNVDIWYDINLSDYIYIKFSCTLSMIYSKYSTQPLLWRHINYIMSYS